jgi:hypothetical protein
MATYLAPTAYGHTHNGQQSGNVDPYRSTLALSSLMLSTPGYLTTGPRGKQSHSALPRKQGGKQDVYDEALAHWIASGSAQSAPVAPVIQPIPQSAPAVPTLPVPSRSPHATVNHPAPAQPTLVPAPQQLQSPIQNAIEQHHATQSIAQPPAQSFDIASLAAMLSALGVVLPVNQVAVRGLDQQSLANHNASTIQEAIKYPQDSLDKVHQSTTGVPTLPHAGIPATSPLNGPPSPTAPVKQLSGKGAEIPLRDKDTKEIIPWIRDRFVQRMDGVTLQLSLSATLPDGRSVAIPLENGGAAQVRLFDSGGAGFYVGGRSKLTDAAGDKWGMQVGCNISAVKYIGRE